MDDSASDVAATWEWVRHHPSLPVKLLGELPAMVAYVDRDQISRFRNHAMQRWLGREVDDRREVSLRELLGPAGYRSVVRYVEGAQAGQPQFFERTSPSHFGGSDRYETSYLPMDGPDGADGFVVMIQDATRRAAGESMRSHALIRSALLEERARLALLLQDEALQRLFTVGLDLDQLADLPPDAAQRVEQARETLQSAVDSLRQTIDAVTRGGGASSPLPGLGQLVHNIAESAGIRASVEHVGSFDDVPEQVTEHLLLVVAEAMDNVASHANAGEVSVTLVRDNDDIVLTVADDGVGLGATGDRVLSAVANPGTLTRLADRADRLGGSLTTTDNSPRGTVLVWRAPLPDRRA